MSATSEQSAKMGMDNYSELLNLETSVLRTLCLTVNATGSELKYRIIDTLSEDDFYFPINKALFTEIIEMHRRGDYVVYTALEEELRHKSIDMPEDLFIEDFFRGELPELEELNKWIKTLKERSRGEVISEKVGGEDKATPSSSPDVTPPPKSMPAAKASSKSKATPSSSPAVNLTQVRSKTESRKIVSKTDPPVKSPPKAAPQKAKSPVLSSEGDEWADYLDDLASQQGRTFETGFVGIDEEAGGLSTGLMVLVDEEQERCIGFLKQLTDQIAIKTKAPCLFLSFETTKPILRIWTLSRLSGVPAKDIERGRLKKDSQDWEAVDRNGRKAASWLKRVFVVEGAASTNLDQLRELGRQLVEPAEDATGVVVIDALEKLESNASIKAKIAELKALAESLDVLVVAASSNRNTLSAPDIDFIAELGESDGEGVSLKIARAGEASNYVRLMYRPTIHKFVEQ
jgi:hypothetical protein